MILVWKESGTESNKNKLFNKLDAGIKEALNSNLKESLPNKGTKDIATTLMSRKIGENLYISPNGRKYRRITSNGQKASKTRTKH